MKSKLKNLFSPINIGELEIKNRIVRSATIEVKGNHGRITDDYIAFYKELAAGGAGMLITGYGTVMADNRGETIIDLSSDACLDGLSRLADTVHRYGSGCKIIFQLCHTGRQMHGKRNDLIAPSAVIEPVYGNVPREMTPEEIRDCVEAFAAAIKRCRDAGIDGVQLHAAHGWLLSTFLSPATNLRTDRYGVDAGGRTRIMKEIIERGRELTCGDYPILAKINGCDFVENGLEPDQALENAECLVKAGFDALEISSCMWATTKMPPEKIGWEAEMIPEARKGISTIGSEGYHRDFARMVKNKMPEAVVIVVGGLRTPQLFEEIIDHGEADMISMSRPFIREPALPARWEKGDFRKAECISCNACLETLSERNLHCPMK